MLVQEDTDDPREKEEEPELPEDVIVFVSVCCVDSVPMRH